MKKLILITLLSLAMSAVALADGTRYEMRVDGLSCPFCVYGVEKKLKKIDGVENIEVDLDNGLVIVNVASGVTLTEAQMAELMTDAGFTFRSMVAEPLVTTEAP